MDFTIYNNILSFFQDNILLAVVAVLLIAFLVYKKPKLFFSLFFLILVMIGIFYMITFLSDTGASKKKELLHEKGLPWQNR